jgi:hypothetical protein
MKLHSPLGIAALVTAIMMMEREATVGRGRFWTVVHCAFQQPKLTGEDRARTNQEHSNRKRRIPMSNKTVRPGQTVPRSGQYEIQGARGGNTGKERTMVRGETVPPTPKSGQSFKLVDPTRNNAGKGK